MKRLIHHKINLRTRIIAESGYTIIEVYNYWKKENERRFINYMIKNAAHPQRPNLHLVDLTTTF